VHAIEAASPKPRYAVTATARVLPWVDRLLPTRAADLLHTLNMGA